MCGYFSKICQRYFKQMKAWRMKGGYWGHEDSLGKPSATGQPAMWPPSPVRTLQDQPAVSKKRHFSVWGFRWHLGRGHWQKKPDTSECMLYQSTDVQLGKIKLFLSGLHN